MKTTRSRPTAAPRPIGSEDLVVLDEPPLEFAGGQLAIDPHDGLALYGPFTAGGPSHPQSPAHVVVGAPEGVLAMSAWGHAFNQSFAATDPRRPDQPEFKHRLWPPYPGFEVAFGGRWPDRTAATYELDRGALLEASRKRDVEQTFQAEASAGLVFAEGLRTLSGANLDDLIAQEPPWLAQQLRRLEVLRADYRRRVHPDPVSGSG